MSSIPQSSLWTCVPTEKISNATTIGPEEETGVRFIRCRVHSIAPAAPNSDDLRIEYVDETGKMHAEIFDLVVLSIGLQVSKESKALAERIGIEIDASGFARTSSFSPVASSRPGVFTCGAFCGPKDIPFSVMEASAASAASAALALRIAKFSDTGKDLSA